MSNEEIPTSKEVARRRRQLQRWIDHHFAGSQAAFAASTNDGEKQINAGELSGLLNAKSFGEKKAKKLEGQAGMPPRYLESDADPSEPAQTVHEPAPVIGANVVHARLAQPWPFKLASYQRLAALQRSLGPKVARDAVNNMDELLDAVMARWEKIALQQTSRAQ